jgi:MFS family permease
VADIETESQRGAAQLTRPGSTFGPFRYPAFRAIWIANLASNLGSMIQSVAAAWLMTDLTTSHRLIALVQASATIPIMLFGIVAGAIADNYDRRRVMLAAQIGMLLTSAVLALTTWLGLINPYLLLAFTLTVGIGTALNSPAWQASVRQQVGLADLPQAISLNTISFNLARSVGPALGGLLLSIWNVSLAFAINAASFVAMIVVLWRWRPTFPPIERKPMLPAIALGLKFCATSSPLRRVLIRGLAFGFGVAGYQALVPAAVRDRLHGSEIDFGLMLGLFGIGSISTALFVSKARRRFGIEAVLAAATLSFVLAQSTLAAASSVWQALPAAFLAGGGWVMALTSLNVSMQLRSPENIIGRCLSIYQAVTFGGMALGSWAWGAIADWRDLPTALHGASVFLLVSIVVLRVLSPMPKPHEGRLDGAPSPSIGR